MNGSRLPWQWIAVGFVFTVCCACRGTPVSEAPTGATATAAARTATTAAPSPVTATPTPGSALANGCQPRVASQVFGSGRISDIAVSASSATAPGGEMLAVAGRAGVRLYRADTLEWVRTLDAQTGETVLVLEVEGACASPWNLVWSPDGRRIAAANALIDAHTGDVVTELDADRAGLGPGRPGWPIRFRSDGAYIAAGGQVSGPGDPTPLVVWDARTGQVAVRIAGGGVVSARGQPVPRVAIAFAGESLFALYEDGELARWSFGSKSQERNVLGCVPVIAAQPPLSFSVDGRRFAAGSRFGGAAVWEVATGRLLASFDEPLGSPTLSPNGGLLALTDREREELVLVDLAGDDAALRLPGARSFPAGKAFSPDGTQIAYGAGSRLLVADVVSGQQTAVLEGYPPDQVISRVIWSPNGNALVSASGKAGVSGALAPLILWQRSAQGTWTEVLRTETTRWIRVLRSAGTL